MPFHILEAYRNIPGVDGAELRGLLMALIAALLPEGKASLAEIVFAWHRVDVPGRTDTEESAERAALAGDAAEFYGWAREELTPWAEAVGVLPLPHETAFLHRLRERGLTPAWGVTGVRTDAVLGDAHVAALHLAEEWHEAGLRTTDEGPAWGEPLRRSVRRWLDGEQPRTALPKLLREQQGFRQLADGVEAARTSWAPGRSGRVQTAQAALLRRLDGFLTELRELRPEVAAMGQAALEMLPPVKATVWWAGRVPVGPDGRVAAQTVRMTEDRLHLDERARRGGRCAPSRRGSSRGRCPRWSPWRGPGPARCPPTRPATPVRPGWT
ncbi:hypothetical protein ACWV95_20200 [Streptomyces albus]